MYLLTIIENENKGKKTAMFINSWKRFKIVFKLNHTYKIMMLTFIENLKDLQLFVLNYSTVVRYLFRWYFIILFLLSL